MSQTQISVSLFGKLQIRQNGTPLASEPSRKAKELLAYLLLHRRRHPREKLATLLWEHGTTDRVKAYLRKALWKLRKAFGEDDDGSGEGAEDDAGPGVLDVDGDWVRIHPRASLWVDVADFEETFAAVRDCEASEMTDAQVGELEEAVALYTGDLLENWYPEWCLRERERLQNLLLRMLDRLTRCCEQRERYDAGIQYGLRTLRIDPARERTHRHLMRLRARSGNRTAALRQYEQCAEVLDRELGVRPATATRQLYEQIKNDRVQVPAAEVGTGEAEMGEAWMGEAGDALQVPGDADDALPSADAGEVSLRDGLDRIRQLQRTLAAVQRRIRHEIEVVEGALQKQGGEA